MQPKQTVIRKKTARGSVVCKKPTIAEPGPDVYSDEDAMMKFTAPPDNESEY